MIFNITRGFLLLLAVLGVVGVSFRMAWLAYGVLDSIPLEHIVYATSLVLFIAWVTYGRWLWGVFSKRRSDQAARVKWYVGANGQALVSTPPYNMATLERKTHDWRLDGRPGSVGGAVIGLDAIDKHTALQDDLF